MKRLFIILFVVLGVTLIPTPASADLAQTGFLISTPNAFLSVTNYSINCPPPPGTVLPPVHPSWGNQSGNYNAAFVQCDGHTWYRVTYFNDPWWIPDTMVECAAPPALQCLQPGRTTTRREMIGPFNWVTQVTARREMIGPFNWVKQVRRQMWRR